MPEVKTAEGSKIFTIQYDAAGKTAHQDMIEQVKKQGVTKLDIVGDAPSPLPPVPGAICASTC